MEDLIILPDCEIDSKTGEIVKQVKRKKFRDDFIMCFQNDFIDIFKNKKLSGNSLRVFGYIMCKVGYKNMGHILQKEISQEMGIHQTDVSKALRLLEKEHIIISRPNVGRTKVYEINKMYAWKGTVESYQKAQRVN